MSDLTNIQQQVLKKELLKSQLSHEFIKLNDFNGLRKFGSPFLTHTPKTGNNKSIQSVVKLELSDWSPVLSFVLNSFIIPFPLFNQELIHKSKFWQDKLQIFFEYFINLQLSDSISKQKPTSRKNIARFLTNTLTHLFISTPETLIDTNSNSVKDSILPIDDILKYFITTQPIYINNWDINILLAVSCEDINASSASSFFQTSKWVKTISTSSTTILSKLTISEDMTFSSGTNASTTPTISPNDFKYLLKIEQNGNIYYCWKSYEQFKELEITVKAIFPGKKAPLLPLKHKRHRQNLSSTNIRILLRQYLRKLVNDKDIAKSRMLFKFFTKDSTKDLLKNDPSLNDEIVNNQMIDFDILRQQLQERNDFIKKYLDVRANFNTLKEKLFKDDKVLIYSIIKELRTKKSINELSTEFKSFVDWLKFFLSYLFYKLFIGSTEKNSNGFFNQALRFHKLMPYAMMKQIIKISNPMAIMKSLIDLFLVSPFGGYSLLQTMFSTILTEDLKHQTKITKKIETKLVDKNKNSSRLTKVLKNFIQKDSRYNQSEIEEMFLKSNKDKTPICLIVLKEMTRLKLIENDFYKDLFKSYSNFKKLNENNTAVTDKSGDNGSYYETFNELYNMYLKERDKKLMRKMWQDSELTQLIKYLVNLIYDPMVKIFEIMKVDISLKEFEKFMNDLLNLLEIVINGGHKAQCQVNVIKSIHDVIDKHQDAIYDIIHDMYTRDKNGLIDEYVEWFRKLITFIKTLMLEDDTKIDLNDLLLQYNDKDGCEKIIQEVNQIINRKRKLKNLRNSLVEDKRDEVNQFIVNTGKDLETKSSSASDSHVKRTQDFISEMNDQKMQYKQLHKKKINKAEINSFEETVFVNVLKDVLKKNSHLT